MSHYQHDKYTALTTAAPGWFAVFNRGGRLEKVPVLAWAVKEREPEESYLEVLKEGGYTTWNNVTDVVGITLDTGLDEDHKYETAGEMLYEVGDVLGKDTFLGYDYPDCGVDWGKTLNKRLEKLKNEETE